MRFLRKNILQFKFLFVVFATVFAINFMFVDKTMRQRRPGIFPIVNFQISSGTNVFFPDEKNWIKTATDAGTSWFRQGGAKVNFGFNGVVSGAVPASPLRFDCSGAVKDYFSSLNDSVFVASAEDPDCTGFSCTYSWSCGDEIYHSDTQINPTFANEKSNDIDWVLRLLVHSFGHSAGLDHCNVGDTEAQCAQRMSPNASVDPSPDSVMNKLFTSANVSLNFDDIVGIQKLYGAYVSRFPTSGDYALNNSEIEMLSGMENDSFQQISTTGEPQSPAEIRKSIGELLSYVPADSRQIDLEIEQWVSDSSQVVQPPSNFFPSAPTVPEKPTCDPNNQNHIVPFAFDFSSTTPSFNLSVCKYVPPSLTATQSKATNAQKMSEFFSSMQGSISGLSKEELATLRVNCVSGVEASAKLKEIVIGDERIDAAQVQAGENYWYSLRQAVIDEEIKR